MSTETVERSHVSGPSAVERRVGRRPTEAEARAAIEAWLDEYAPGYPDYSLCEDGDDDVAENKCGWAFWIAPQDTTSYVHEDLSIEWYGTGWPDDLEYDGETGNWRELPPNVEHNRRTAASSPGVRVDGPVGPHRTGEKYGD